MTAYWTNFARSGDPHSGNLPAWPAFSEDEPVVLHLHDQPETGPVPHLDQLMLMEEYMAWRREF
jgi:para-nitrobenzyl esterase